MLALCFTSNKPLLQLYQTATKLRFEVPFEIYSVHTPEVSPHTIERVICCFWLVLDLVLVFVGFGLFQTCLQLPFSPHSKDHTLHRAEHKASFLEFLDFLLKRYVLLACQASPTPQDITMHHSSSFLTDRSLASSA